MSPAHRQSEEYPLNIRNITRLSLLGLAATLLAGCGTTTIRPDYASTSEYLQIGGRKPVNPTPTIENAGAFCLEVREEWSEDGRTPDGEPLFTRDTLRRAVACGEKAR
jgi:hypothetical protein